MQPHVNRHLVYTQVIRPVARVLVWLPIFGAIVLFGGPVALAIMPVLAVGLIVGIAVSFRKSGTASRSLSTFLKRASYETQLSTAAQLARARFD